MPCLPEPDLVETRGDERLFVWNEAGQWLVADAELAGFLGCLLDCPTPAESIAAYATRMGHPETAVCQEVAPILEELARRGLLGGAHPSPPDDETRIANITVNLTNRCNLSCAWCYNTQPGVTRRSAPPFPPSLFARRVKEGAGILEDSASLFILGGEPFLEKERLFPLLDACQGLFKQPVMISTNGTLLDSAAIAGLRGNSVDVQVSLDSASPAIHDRLRGPGAHALAMNGVRRLVDAGIPVILSMVYSRETFIDFEAYLDLTASLGVDEARFIPLRAIGRGEAFQEVLPRQDDVFHHLLDVIRRRPEHRRLLKRDFFSILAGVCRQGARNHCGIGRRVLFLDEDGAAYPCPNHRSPEHQCGSLHTHSFADMMHTPAMRRIRERYHTAAYPACRACPVRAWCAGDCRGEVLAMTGDMGGSSPHCTALRRVIPEIFWLLARNEPWLAGG